ncbi:MAG: winged helix-turn-helix transcriptional regulator [Candidatus Thorarchaeota archaeon]|nr:MAG: winged helix-turn-helix transcriptional regulator [Candidatus Thorarchaeota archaeon]
MTEREQKLTDESLLDALVRLGGKVTATELADVLGFPDRTIRYRIQRLREKGHLGRVWPQTHDAKIGLGDANLIFDISERYRKLPREFLFCFPNFYANYACYGRYNGCWTGAGYPIANPQILDRIVRAMKKMNIITDLYRFTINDFISLAGDLSKYKPGVGWKWDWKDWVKESEKTLKIGEKFPLKFDINPPQFDYDHKDIEIIAELKMHGGLLTHRELSKRIDLSETQIGVRIRRLKDADVLRGYAWLTEMTPMTVVMFTYIEIDEPDDPVLSSFLHLPFRREIQMDSSDKFCIRLTMDSRDVVGYLKGLETIRSHFRSYFVQTAVSLKVVPGGMQGYYHLHNESTGRWEMPVEESIQKLEKFIEDY